MIRPTAKPPSQKIAVKYVSVSIAARSILDPFPDQPDQPMRTLFMHRNSVAARYLCSGQHLAGVEEIAPRVLLCLGMEHPATPDNPNLLVGGPRTRARGRHRPKRSGR